MGINKNLIHKVEQKLMFGHNTTISKTQVKDIRFACEKQIAVKPNVESKGCFDYSEKWLKCPLCGAAVPKSIAENETECFCARCGQKLKWNRL